ncbi:MAG: hypothetical protein ABEL51_01140 [Salinibacter sp.]
MPSINLYYAVGAYALFSMALFVWLFIHRRSLQTIGLYFLLFTWFCAVQAILVWYLGLIPARTDGITYFNFGADIAASGFQPDVVNQYLKSGIDNLGYNVYVLLQAAIVYAAFPSFALVHIFNIFLATMAIYFAARFATQSIGPHAQKYVIVGFVVYFAWYWAVLQNLREAPLLCALGIAMFYFGLWWVQGSLRYGVFAIVSGLIASLFRAEILLLLIAVTGLALVFRYPSWVRQFRRVLFFIPPLILLAIDLAFRLTNKNPLRLINNARSSRVEAGHHLSNLDASSYWDLLSQFPETLRYFLVPILPWEVSEGLFYFKAYVHSLVAFAFVALAIVGLIRLMTNHHLHYQKRSLVALLLGFTIVAVIFSLIDIGAGAASRHSTFYFYFLLASFVPVGFISLRNMSAKIVYGQPVHRQPSTRARQTAG